MEKEDCCIPPPTHTHLAVSDQQAVRVYMEKEDCCMPPPPHTLSDQQAVRVYMEKEDCCLPPPHTHIHFVDTLRACTHAHTVDRKTHMCRLQACMRTHRPSHSPPAQRSRGLFCRPPPPSPPPLLPPAQRARGLLCRPPAPFSPPPLPPALRARGLLCRPPAPPLRLQGELEVVVEGLTSLLSPLSLLPPATPPCPACRMSLRR